MRPLILPRAPDFVRLAESAIQERFAFKECFMSIARYSSGIYKPRRFRLHSGEHFVRRCVAGCLHVSEGRFPIRRWDSSYGVVSVVAKREQPR